MQALLEAFRAALASLAAHRMRSFLTTLGILIGTGSVIHRTMTPIRIAASWCCVGSMPSGRKRKTIVNSGARNQPLVWRIRSTRSSASLSRSLPRASLLPSRTASTSVQPSRLVLVATLPPWLWMPLHPGLCNDPPAHWPVRSKTRFLPLG